MDKPTDFLNDPEKAAYVERELRSLAFTIPTEPGRYADDTGDVWELKADGHWYDKEGETRDRSWNWVLAGFGPWTLVT